MDQVPHRLAHWWRGLDDRGRRHASLIALAAVGYVVHYLAYCLPQPFFIEDSAITFAYARNLVEGEGLVTYAGGERVEGFSNPLWTFLMAGFYGLGVPMWTASKVVGAVLGVATLPLAAELVRRARPGRDDDVALVAPVLLAASPQFVIWNASGLENSLFCFLLAAGMVRLFGELAAPTDAPRRPWSAVLFFLLTMTRPEAIAYASFAGVALTLDAVATRRAGPLLRWLPAFALPFVAWQAWRYTYFAWEFPNTYYAKLALKKTQFQPWNWSGGGWKYIRKWFGDHGVIWATPLLGLAAVGFRGWRRWVVVVGCAWLALVIGWDGRDGLPRIPDWWRPVQKEWVEIRVWSIAVAAASGGLLTLGRPGWRARGLLWISACFSVFFALYSKGDWMKAHRWFNLASVTLLPLLAIGLGELIDAMRIDQKRLAAPMSWRGRVPDVWLRGVPLRATLLLAPALLWVGAEVRHIIHFANNPETSTRDVHRRVRYMTWVQRRLDIDDIALLDVDMGAHMYFTDWEIIDIAGLVDVPIARHRDFNMKFMKEYVFDERKPDFAHVHGGWASSSKIPRHKEWKAGYIEIPGYPIGANRLHVGNHIRKELFVTVSDTPAPDSAQRFEGGVRLYHARVPSPEVAAGGLYQLDTRWQAGFRRSGFRVLAILDDGQGHRSVQAVAPGWDWYPPADWKATELIDMPFRVGIPEDLPEGDYALSLMLLDEKSGGVLRHLGDMGGYRAPLSPDDGGPGAPDSGAGDTDDTNDTDSGDGGPDDAATQPDADDAARSADEGGDTFRARDGQAEPAGASDRTGHPSAANPHPGGAVTDTWATGVVVRVVAPEVAASAAAADLEAALAAAVADDCDRVWPTFKDATRHRLTDLAWREQTQPSVRAALADCLVRRAAAADDRADTIGHLLEARRHDRHSPAMLAAARPLAAQLDAAGDAAFATGDWEAAYAAYRDAVALDPRRSFSRRKAEDARDLKLDITRPGREPTPEPRADDDDDDDDDTRAGRKPPRVRPGLPTPKPVYDDGGDGDGDGDAADGADGEAPDGADGTDGTDGDDPQP